MQGEFSAPHNLCGNCGVGLLSLTGSFYARETDSFFYNYLCKNSACSHTEIKYNEIPKAKGGFMSEEVNLDSTNEVVNVRNRERILAEWDKQAREKNEPYCRSCATRDLIKGNKEDRKAYQTLALFKTNDDYYTGRDASMAGKLLGKTFFYKCPKEHTVIYSFSNTELERFKK